MDALAHSKANPWFQQAFTYLNIDLGRDYLALFSSWIDKERIGAYESPRAGLKKEHRPAALSTWQKKRFNEGSEPDIYDEKFVVSFSGEIWVWWVSLQPAWREIAPGTKPNYPPVISTGMTDWQSLDKKGLNGWFGLLVCLKWWGLALEYCPADQRNKWRDDWLRAIHDVSAMLDSLLAYYRTSAK